MLIKLGLVQRPKPPGPISEAEPPPPPAEQVSALDAAIRDLELSEPRPAGEPKVRAQTTEDLSVPEQVPAAIKYWLARYRRNSSESSRNIRELAAKAPDLTVDTIMPLYAAGDCEAATFLAGILGRSTRTVEKLCDSAAALEGAIRLAQALERQEPQFDAHFAKTLLVDDRMTEAALQRGLTIMEHFRSGGRLVPIMIQFLRNPECRIRSRAALMLGRIMPTPRLMYRLMQDQDPRVRANFVEGLWNSAADHRALFHQSLHDPHQRVVGNALVGLHRSGQTTEVIHHVARLGRHPDARFRATAAWVMGQTGEERYATVLRHMLDDQDLSVRRNALNSLQQIQGEDGGNCPGSVAGADQPGRSLPT